MRSLFAMLGLSSVVLSGCFLMGAQARIQSLQELQLPEEGMPKVCKLREAPGKRFPCPFDKNPYYSNDPKFVSCVQRILGPSLRGFEMDEVWLQAFIEKPGSRDLGMFAFRLKNQADVKPFQTHLHNLAKTLKNERPLDHLIQQGRMVMYFWNDATDNKVCYPAFQKRVFKQMGYQAEP